MKVSSKSGYKGGVFLACYVSQSVSFGPPSKGTSGNVYLAGTVKCC